MTFKLKQYIYFVKNMKEMRNFYENVLGLKIIRNKTYSEEDWVELGNVGFKICLHKFSKKGSEGNNKNKIVFKVDDVGSAREYLLKHQVKMEKHHVWEEIEDCDGTDPEGNRFQIASDRK